MANSKRRQSLEPVQPQRASPTSPSVGTPAPTRDRWAKLPAVEIELVHELRSPPYVDKPWKMLEVWTQNRIYAIDAHMRCIDVVDQQSGKSVRDHGLIGAKLVGGQHREEGVMHLSHPFPRPGTEAVFEQPTKSGASFSQSSTVSRVVLRLRHITILSGMEMPTWDQIAGTSGRAASPEE